MNRAKITHRRLAHKDDRDFYPTPAWATEALLDMETFSGRILEPACGDGAISCILGKQYTVWSSDLWDHGYGLSGEDFLLRTKKADNIVTNPPYHLAEAFVHQGLKLTRNKLCLLLRLAFLEGGGRAKRIYKVGLAPSRVWVFSERITFYRKGAERKGGGTNAYAWFVWDKAYKGPTLLKWIPLGFKPTSKAAPGNRSQRF